MNRKTIVLFVLLFGLILIGMITFAILKKGEVSFIKPSVSILASNYVN